MVRDDLSREFRFWDTEQKLTPKNSRVLTIRRESSRLRASLEVSSTRRQSKERECRSASLSKWSSELRPAVEPAERARSEQTNCSITDQPFPRAYSRHWRI